MAFIASFLEQVEGPSQVRGYVPSIRKSDDKGRNYIGANGLDPRGVEFPSTGDPSAFTAMGASGVTIATGCDLGQTDIATLRAYGITSQTLLNRLAPYIGLKKSDALKKLFSLPLLLEPAEASLLNQAVHGGYLSRYVRPAFEKASQMKFDALPKEAQAVVFSLCFQLGCGGASRNCPRTWKYLTQCDWASASYELCHGFSQYRNRRVLEGKLLEALL